MTTQNFLKYFLLTLVALGMYWVPGSGCCLVAVIGFVALVLSIAKKPVASWAWFLVIQGVVGAIVAWLTLQVGVQMAIQVGIHAVNTDVLHVLYWVLAVVSISLHWLVLWRMKKLP